MKNRIFQDTISGNYLMKFPVHHLHTLSLLVCIDYMVTSNTFFTICLTPGKQRSTNSRANHTSKRCSRYSETIHRATNRALQHQKAGMRNHTCASISTWLSFTFDEFDSNTLTEVKPIVLQRDAVMNIIWLPCLDNC